MNNTMISNAAVIADKRANGLKKNILSQAIAFGIIFGSLNNIVFSSQKIHKNTTSLPKNQSQGPKALVRSKETLSQHIRNRIYAYLTLNEIMKKTALLSKAERESLPNSKLIWGNRKGTTTILSRPQALNDYQLNILQSINNLALEYNNENNDILGINLAAFAQRQISINHMHFYPSPAAQNNAEYFAFLMRSDQEFNHVKTITFYNNVGQLIPDTVRACTRAEMEYNSNVEQLGMRLFSGKKIIFTSHQNPNYLLQNSTANKADELIFVTNQLQDRIMIAQAIADMAKESSINYCLSKKINNIYVPYICNLMNIDLDNRIIVNFLEAFLFKGDIASACNTLRGQDLAPKSSIDVEFIILSFVKDKHEKAKSMHQIAKDNITLGKYNAARSWCKKALSQSDNAELTSQINNSLKAIENELAPQKN